MIENDNQWNMQMDCIFKTQFAGEDIVFSFVSLETFSHLHSDDRVAAAKNEIVSFFVDKSNASH